MNLGTTIEEKRQNYQALTKGAKKWGKAFGCLAVVIFIWFTGMAFSMDDLSLMNKLLFSVLGALAIPTYYAGGHIAYYGYITAKLWLLKRNIKMSDVALNAADATVTVTGLSYLFGGRKAAKTSFLVSVFLILFVMSIGLYVGLYQYFKIRSEAKRLALA